MRARLANGWAVCSRLIRGVMQFRIWLMAAVASGCHVGPAPITAHQSCGLAPNVWQHIDTPSNRDALFKLLEQTTRKPVAETFEASMSQREEWFADSSGNLQACLFNPTNRMSCYQRELHLVVFLRNESSWVAGPTRQALCVD